MFVNPIEGPLIKAAKYLPRTFLCHKHARRFGAKKREDVMRLKQIAAANWREIVQRMQNSDAV
jgi:hypothetical protein